MSTIVIAGREYEARRARRNYYACKFGRCGRTGTIVLLPKNVTYRFKANFLGKRARKETPLVVVCEKCGRYWVPHTGPALRALRA